MSKTVKGIKVDNNTRACVRPVERPNNIVDKTDVHREIQLYTLFWSTCSSL